MRASKYQRNGWWTIKVPHPAGGVKALSAKTKDEKLADRIVGMCDLLMERPNDHEFLVAVCAGSLALRALYSHWATSKLEVLRAQISDVDLAQTLVDWRGHLVTQFGEPDASAHTVNQYTRQVAHFFAFCASTRRSALTAQNASRWITSLSAVSTGRRARYWAALKAFILYLQSLGLVTDSPIARLAAPPLGDARDRHLSHADMWRLIEASPGRQRVAEVLAHLGLELSAVRRARRSDVDLAANTVFAHGTKRKKGRKNYRSRRCHIHKWAREELARACDGLAPSDLLVPLSDLVIQTTHVKVCARLAITDYRFHDGRHTYAVAMVKAGTPSRVVGKQLGHKDGQQVERVYANYAPTMQELEYWADREHTHRSARQPQLQKQVQAAFSPSISGQDVCPSLPRKGPDNGLTPVQYRQGAQGLPRLSATKPLTFFLPVPAGLLHPSIHPPIHA